MAGARISASVRAHLEWLGFVRPVGLVVSPTALDRAGAVLPRNDREGQELLEQAVATDDEGKPFLPDFGTFARSVLGWRFKPAGYAGGDGAEMPNDLAVELAGAREKLRPDIAVRERDPEDGMPRWQLFVSVLAPGTDLDRTAPRSGAVAGAGGLDASPRSRLERLLRETGVPAGLLFNGRTLRLVSAPHGESSGWIDFHVEQMLLPAGRPICAAMRLLLSEQRLLSLPRRERLARLLRNSRKYQNEVSERLADQVLHALHELLRGFAAADEAAKGHLLGEQLREDRDAIYHGLLTVMMRIVFLLYAEERELLVPAAAATCDRSDPAQPGTARQECDRDPESTPAGDGNAAFARHYSLAALHERLTGDAALHPDTMGQRYGAWAQLLTLFRMIHGGARAAGFRLPIRRGVLFDPDRYPFLEGRAPHSVMQTNESVPAPLVPDGTILRVLDKLLVLGGERLSYRALDVEHIGSVYEKMMGFRLERAKGRSVAIRPAQKHGAPAVVSLDALLAQAPGSRATWLTKEAGRKLSHGQAHAVRAADTLEALHAALDPVIDRHTTPDIVPEHGLVLQPSEERRKSGSHYTPRSMTEPIVRRTLEPIVERLRSRAADGSTAPDGASPQDGARRSDGLPVPTQEQILGLCILDPAMGSGAFLVEACRQLGELLVQSWNRHGEPYTTPSGDAGGDRGSGGLDRTVLARRLVARNFLYGVDRNPIAVDLAKLSLWLATLDRDAPLTFLDHALRHGDALVGLDLQQIRDFHWQGGKSGFQLGTETTWIGERIREAERLRREIQQAPEEAGDDKLRERLKQAEEAQRRVRLIGDLVTAAFFEADKPKSREALRQQFIAETAHWPAATASTQQPSSSEAASLLPPGTQQAQGAGRSRTDDLPPAPARDLPVRSEGDHGDLPGQERPRADPAVPYGDPDPPAQPGPRPGPEAPPAAWAAWLEHLRHRNPPLAPFHWDIEFPEVFQPEDRPNPGFDAVVGNPPFAGKNTVAAANPDYYPQWLKQLHENSHGNSDLVAHFFRRSFGLLRQGGALGLIATNTIAQGDTRATGLRWICTNGGTIYRATRRYKWPRLAAVVVSILHIHRGNWTGQRILDGQTVPEITAFLFHAGGHDDPERLQANAGKSFQGSIVLGMGFTFDDTDRKGVATPLSEMNRLIAANPRNREVIFPYIGGKEVNDSPTHAHHRYVINFRDWPLRRADLGQTWEEASEDNRRDWLRAGVVPLDYPDPVAADWPELLVIVEEKVKPARNAQNWNNLRARWWHYSNKALGLYSTIKKLDRVLVISRVGQQASFAFLPQDLIYADSLIVFPFDTATAFCVLQSRPHEIWARFFASSMKDDLRYTPSDCFETFPFPFDLPSSAPPPPRKFQGAPAASKPQAGPTTTSARRSWSATTRASRRPTTASTTRTRATLGSASSANCMPKWTASFWTPTDGATSRPTASSCLTTRSTKRPGAARRSPGATAGRTTPATKSSPA